MDYLKKLSNNSKAISYSVLTCFCVSVMISIVRHLSDDFHAFFIVLMRNIFAFSMFLPLLIRTKGAVFKTNKLGLHFTRALNGCFGMMLWFSIVKMIPLPELVSFTFTVPIFTTLVAMIFLKENVSKKVWISLMISFIGVLVIARPGFKEFSIAYPIAILVTIMWSITNLLIKKLTKTESAETIVFFMSWIMLLISLPFGLLHLQAVSFVDLLWFVALGFTSNFSHIFMSRAYAKADLYFVQPFDFTRLIFTSIIAYFAFGEVLDLYTFIGSLIIMIGVIYTIPKRKKIDSKL